MVLKNKYSDQELINGIRKNDSKMISLIYKYEYDRIKSMVICFKNINMEPGDIFQEGLTRAILNIRKGTFRGDSKFSTYLYGICRNLCLKEYNRRTPYLLNIEHKQFKDDSEDDNFDLLNFIIKMKSSLDEKCRKIIDLRFGLASDDGQSIRFEAIASSLGISNDNARQRFRRCFAKLKSLIKENQEINQLIF